VFVFNGKYKKAKRRKELMNRIIWVVMIVTIVTIFCIGCSAFMLSTEQRLAITSGKIGCPPEKITISNLKRPGGGMSTWTAKCEGREYNCSRETNISSCTPANVSAGTKKKPASVTTVKTAPKAKSKVKTETKEKATVKTENSKKGSLLTY
jgi:hypothetical protein